MKYFPYIILFVFYSQIIQSQPANIENAYFEAMFSGNYPEGMKILSKLKKEYPNTVKTKLITANYYAAMYETSGSSDKYFILTKKYAEQTINLLEKIENPNNDAVSEIISAKSILLKINVLKRNFLKVAQNTQSIIKYFEYAMKHESESDKLKLISGMYKYYVETAKEDHPVIYPVLIFYPSGNKAEGLKLLKECTHSEDKTTAARSTIMLAMIYYRDEKNINTSKYYFNKILSKYPDNMVWQTEYYKALKKYDMKEEAEKQKKLIENKLSTDNFLDDEQKKYFSEIINN
ncbi:MAG: tetratricopeptide repeat protein [Chlorobi bacterium]|nr:tetratricopeptide repeat protein [Chlorobiota bacterium]